LIVTDEQADVLRETLAVANAACNAISEVAWEHQTFGQFALHKATYAATRARFPLAAQVVVRCLAKVADAYKRDKTAQRTFRPTGAIAYDERILRWYVGRSTVSLWTVKGRITVPFVCGERQRALLATQQGETDLCCQGGGIFFLNTICNVEESPPADVSGGVLGMDLGIVNLATDSEGREYSGERVRSLRRRLRRLRSGLQYQAKKHNSKSAARHLAHVRRRASHFTRWVNHNIAKQIVQSAISSRKAIAMEDLTGIRQRASAYRREMRWQIGNWAFLQLAQFVCYKAQRVGVPVVFIDPRNTSRTCSRCGHCDKANRKNQSQFLCLSYGFAENADRNAACNIAKHGAIVTRPMDGTKAVVFAPALATVKAPAL
jgi:IS605 OrfB family transposase